MGSGSERCVQTLTSIFLAIAMSLSITCAANSWWVRNATAKSRVGIWQLCIDDSCKPLWDVTFLKDNEWFVAATGVWMGGVLAVTIAEVLWIIYTCRRSRAMGNLIATTLFTCVAFGCFLATVLIWWLKLQKDDTALLGSFGFHWTYYVACGTTAVTLLASVLTLIGCCSRSGTSV